MLNKQRQTKITIGIVCDYTSALAHEFRVNICSSQQRCKRVAQLMKQKWRMRRLVERNFEISPPDR